jgi:hypothetical protein
MLPSKSTQVRLSGDFFRRSDKIDEEFKIRGCKIVEFFIFWLVSALLFLLIATPAASCVPVPAIMFKSEVNATMSQSGGKPCTVGLACEKFDQYFKQCINIYFSRTSTASTTFQASQENIPDVVYDLVP